MKALVLAAGLGTRLRPYTHLTPKPLFTVAGVTMLDRIIGQLEKAGCTQIMVNTHHLAEKITDHIERSSYKSEVRAVYEPVILDTGGALKNIETFWDDSPFFVVNSDIYTDFDFSLLYEEHEKSGSYATLLMHDEPRFNNVAVRSDSSISGFRTNASNDERLLAFTGIQVVSPAILNVIPKDIPYSIIDAYRNLISKGHRIEAYLSSKFLWEDIGTPEAYLSLSRKVISEKNLGNDSSGIRIEKLKGDGSDRKWFRVSGKGKNIVLAEHGIKNTDLTCEAEAFFHIGRHLFNKGINVPKIIEGDTFSGHVLVEDLGGTHLEDYVKAAASRDSVRKIYEKVISGLTSFSVFGSDGFDDNWAWQTTEYSKAMVLEKECHYFRDSFLKNYLGLLFEDHDLEPAFEHVSEGASSKGFKGLMHRDFQSRNIMIRSGAPYFIDFQGARRGPFEYDLASLLIDPYVNLEDSLKKDLEDYAFNEISRYSSSDRKEFEASLNFCKVARNLQILGAFSFLSMVKAKKHFKEYIPDAIKSLEKNLLRLPDDKSLSFLIDIASRASRPVC